MVDLYIYHLRLVSLSLKDAIKAVKKIVRNVNDVMHSSDLIGCPVRFSTTNFAS